jgi:hypothetical protein
MSAFGTKQTLSDLSPNVGFWHKADITALMINARFWG